MTFLIFWAFYVVFGVIFVGVVEGKNEETVLHGERRSYKFGERIVVECLNRTVDTGEHVSEAGFVVMMLCLCAGLEQRIYNSVSRLEAMLTRSTKDVRKMEQMQQYDSIEPALKEEENAAESLYR
jgi:hypothetical protein